ncbi:bifunctional diaminohydroxyphosphoribosylaminopyrimidine deaminase/5-amino-6-(5-phosphoribosylamino)uracil reductase RibD [uncultured Paludibaculum sp.]|uniref:bifunctional diaminohydroxyphosphoribosylaminopyrimidine deaminase/5-amino-6-(5-phosphoribosylamino)uracil reductase RibD n=1 Tax=uncultured Paludibaculum sp. TaxID=1765020 RepID=UPI002AAA6C34|nr:bifunctional diaminohydroxyphosphoribosylaminopyrimidine deaminase/5-amino-6-(5-phosphoribosylamino)uracil reductase RibD [uncultured Paludibaculum sp.]
MNYLRVALDLARQGLGRVTPNPAVGAVLVRDDVVVGQGFHTWAGVKHAEVLALEAAGEKARGATLYINLEPCSHMGRTAPCADALIAAGVKKVVAITEDPNPQVEGRGFGRLRAAGVEVEVDPEFAQEATDLNLAFFHYMRTGRPLVTLKSALTLDGKIAAPEDNSGWITSERARAHVQQIRHLHDAILTGIDTVLSDDCLLTDRSGLERSRPLLRIVVDSQLRIPLTSKMVTSARGDLLVVCSSVASPSRRQDLEKLGIEVLAADGPGGRTDLKKIVEVLGTRKYLSLMIEAGSKVNWSALEYGVADRIFFYYAPKILGGLQSLPVAGGIGKRRRADAIRFTGTKLHVIPPDEFAVEAWLTKS